MATLTTKLGRCHPIQNIPMTPMTPLSQKILKTHTTHTTGMMTTPTFLAAHEKTPTELPQPGRVGGEGHSPLQVYPTAVRMSSHNSQIIGASFVTPTRATLDASRFSRADAFFTT